MNNIDEDFQCYGINLQIMRQIEPVSLMSFQTKFREQFQALSENGVTRLIAYSL
jgi:hypothetical protein